MKTERKGPKEGAGRFVKGTSGNPAGRPPHSRNRSTLLMEAMLEGEAEQLTRKLIGLASSGDITAMRLCMERLLPPRKDRPVNLTLAPVENIQQVSSAMSTVVKAIGNGSITPGEGEILANVLAVQTNVLSTGDLDRRVERLEQALFQNEKTGQEADLAQRLREGRSPPVDDQS
jgi:hypothetical protein